MNVQLQFFREK